MKTNKTRMCPLTDMVTYSTGECANSLVMNALFGFAMLYYTDALGLSPSLAGLAMSIAIFWDAVSDPIMGHISDNTRSRFGKRHPYLLVGGFGMVVSFYFLWQVPDFCRTNLSFLFWYLVTLNLLLRTFFTIFVVPYTALGFEMCSDYDGRTKLQSVKTVMNMIANFCGPALSWAIFFKSEAGTRSTDNPQNFLNMGTCFSIATLIFVVFVFWATLKYMKDSRDEQLTGNSIKGFFVDMKEILTDRYPRWAFAFIFIVVLGIALASSLQMYLYEHFMRFSSVQKSIAHGGTMAGMALGAAAATWLSKFCDKKGSILIAGTWSVVCNVVLAIIFLPGWVQPDQTVSVIGFSFPVAFVCFVFFHGAYWFGNGVMLPIAMSMMADVSEIHELTTGANKDGGYSAVFSFASKMAASVGVFVSGYALSIIGFAVGKNLIQSSEVTWRLCALTLLVGPLISLFALVLITKYPVTKELIGKFRDEFENNKTMDLSH